MNNVFRLFRSTYNPTLIIIIFTILVTACASPAPTSSPPVPTSPPAPTSPPPTPSVSVKAIAEEIAAGVGSVKQVNEGSPEIVIVFEETHNSPAGQTEIATMMNRLYENYGMKEIALEGYFTESGNLDTSWFPEFSPFVAKEPIREREDVIVQLLQDGEISSSEMMALTYKDVIVTGVEISSEYDFELSDDASSAPILYLYQIAAPGLTNEEINKTNELFQADKILEAVEFVISTDEWTSEEYALMNDETRIISAEEWLKILDEIEARAVNADVSDYKQGMDNLRQFYETASQRSRTMVSNTLEISKNSPNVPVAMVIGAAHTELVANLFTNQGISFAVIRGNALDSGSENGDLSNNAYDRKIQNMSVDLPGSLGALLDGRKKPQPVVNEVWFQGKAQIFLLTDILARAAASGKTPPFDDVLNNLPELKGVTLDKSSIAIKDDDVVFSVTALDNSGNEVTVWVRARTDGEAVEKLLEGRLQEALEEVQSKGAPSNEDENTPSKPELTAISSQTIAEFSTDQSLIISSDI
ncbi:MAG: hypothetical protein IT312_09190 [Anaerolineales bacterium]|nr:hypothetical protein [Anaerolineales bacterium]